MERYGGGERTGGLARSRTGVAGYSGDRPPRRARDQRRPAAVGSRRRDFISDYALGMALTKKQKRLQKEIDEIASVVGMDHWNISQYEAAARTPVLKSILNNLIRGEIITEYTLVDELLTAIINNYYFRQKLTTGANRNLWRQKHFRILNQFILDDAYIVTKVRAVNEIAEIPANIRDFFDRLNSLRNAVAHSFFPENRRQYNRAKKVIYRGTDIFTLQGIRAFEADRRLQSTISWSARLG